jgi:hypothetical protein
MWTAGTGRIDGVAWLDGIPARNEKKDRPNEKFSI